MHLIDELEAQAGREESYFRAYLLREDVSRLRRLLELATTLPTYEAFRIDGLAVGWTPGDMRTHELKPALEPLLALFYRSVRGEAVPDGAIGVAWHAFERLRMDRLVGCLSRVPRPEV